MYTKLARIAELAAEKPNDKFTSLIHLVNKEMLMECHRLMEKNKATGIDGITKEEYGTKLEENIEDLLERMKTFKYRPQAVKRVFIPKAGSDEKRPLGIPSYEDKLVQIAINKIITQIYEQDFLDCSFGFRPNRGCHDALKQLDVYLTDSNINYVVDADIKGFFNNVDHEWMMKFLNHRIADKNLLRYISRFLKAGVMENGSFEKTEAGTPQGGVISPILGNIYLHYALDLWFEKVVKMHCKGEAYIVRYCDDFVCCFEYESEAKSFYEQLKKRLEKFNLQIAEDKTKILQFGKTAYWKQTFGESDHKLSESRTFDFLGFSHYCSCSIKGRFRVKRKTSAKKFRASLQKVKKWLIENMHTPLPLLMRALNLKLVGYYRYYGITDNSKAINSFKDCVRNQLFKVLNRRSQINSYNWDTFDLMVKRYKLTPAKIYVNIFEGRVNSRKYCE